MSVENFIKTHNCFAKNENGVLTQVVNEITDILFDNEYKGVIYVLFWTYEVSEPGVYWCSITNRSGF